MGFDAAVLGIKLFRGLQVVMALGTIILVHEFGHYIVAKWSRMKVDEFAIGIGPTLRRWERNGTTYRVCAFLCMGYVKIAGLEGGGDHAIGSQADTADDGNFYSRPHRQRAAVILAGAAVNVFVAALLFCVLYGTWGVPDIYTSVGDVEPGQPAAEAGVEAGWRIVSIGAKPVHGPGDVIRAVQRSEGEPVTLGLSLDGATRQVTVKPRYFVDEEDPDQGLFRIGINLADDDAQIPVIARIEPRGAADEAGLRRGDRIVAVNGQPTELATEILEALVTVPESMERLPADQVTLPPVRLGVMRGGQTIDCVVHAKPTKQQRPKPLEEGEDAEGVEMVDRPIEDYLVGDPGLVLERRYRRLSVVAALGEGARTGWGVLRNVFESLGFLVQGRGFGQVGGPVLIVKSLSSQAFLGPYALIEWAGILSIMIGVFNLLPLPALDGGRLVFILLEWLLGRPPLRRRTDDGPEPGRMREAMVHSVGLLVLLGLLVLVSIRDYVRYLT